LEEEAMFVWVTYEAEMLPDRYGPNGLDILREYRINIKRASMQKPINGEHSKRIHVDFDPLSRQLCYLVGCFFNLEQPGLITKNIFRPAGVFDTDTDANIFASQVKANNGKEFIEKKEKLDRVEVHPLIIRQK
jgi:hypothetical protein